MSTRIPPREQLLAECYDRGEMHRYLALYPEYPYRHFELVCGSCTVSSSVKLGLLRMKYVFVPLLNGMKQGGGSVVGSSTTALGHSGAVALSLQMIKALPQEVWP